MPLFTGTHFTSAETSLTVGLSRVLFPIVVLLGLNGLVVGILNAYDHFSIPAIAPLVWNVVIIGLLIVLRPLFHGPNQLYAYAIGVLVGTVVQFAMAVPILGRIDFRLRVAFDWRDERIRRVLTLMLPVTIGLGVINFDLLINSSLGTLVSDQAPRAIDAAFRIYMLPQGMFSVAVATVLFPALSRLAARRDYDGLRSTLGTGTRQIALLLIPAAVFTLVLATPITRLIYQHGNFGPHSTDRVSLALFWFSFSLPFAGVNLLLTRTFFSLQRPWIPDHAGDGEHGGRRDRERRAVPAVRDRGTRDRDGRRQRRDDRSAGLVSAQGPVGAAGGPAHDAGRFADRPRVGAHGRSGLGGVARPGRAARSEP